MSLHTNLKVKAWAYGIGAILIVIAINFTILSLLGFPSMAVEIIKKYFPLLVVLVGGFGLQIGLFAYYRSLNAVSCSTAVASGSASVISMVSCCSHYLLNLIPFLGALIGVSALASLSKYTLHFIIFGIVSNAIGLGVIYYQTNKFHKRVK